MTNRDEFYRWLRRHHCTTVLYTKTSDEIADKAEEIWGIGGKDPVIPSNLPSREEFIEEAMNHNEGMLEEDAGHLYNWFVSQLGQSKDQEEPAYKEIPFDLSYALAHRDSVYTETGKKVENLTWFNLGTAFDVAGVVDDELLVFSDEGEYEGGDENYDLVLRKPVKKVRKQGWVNVYKPYTDAMAARLSNVWHDENEARENGRNKPAYIDTVRIEWEESSDEV